MPGSSFCRRPSACSICGKATRSPGYRAKNGIVDLPVRYVALATKRHLVDSLDRTKLTALMYGWGTAGELNLDGKNPFTDLDQLLAENAGEVAAA